LDSVLTFEPKSQFLFNQTTSPEITPCLAGFSEDLKKLGDSRQDFYRLDALLVT